MCRVKNFGVIEPMNQEDSLLPKPEMSDLYGPFGVSGPTSGLRWIYEIPSGIAIGGAPNLTPC